MINIEINTQIDIEISIMPCVVCNCIVGHDKVNLSEMILHSLFGKSFAYSISITFELKMITNLSVNLVTLSCFYFLFCMHALLYIFKGGNYMFPSP